GPGGRRARSRAARPGSGSRRRSAGSPGRAARAPAAHRARRPVRCRGGGRAPTRRATVSPPGRGRRGPATSSGRARRRACLPPAGRVPQRRARQYGIATLRHVSIEDVRFPGAAGRQVAGRWYLPDAAAPVGVVAVAPAMAMPMRFYRHLAAWLAERGFAVLTFSYHGSEPELYGPLRDSTATALDWYHDAEA